MRAAVLVGAPLVGALFARPGAPGGRAGQAREAGPAGVDDGRETVHPQEVPLSEGGGEIGQPQGPARRGGFWERVPESVRLALVPALISFAVMWRALLGLGVFAPTDILLTDSIISQKPPGAGAIKQAQNPLLADVVDTFIPWRLLV